MTAIFWTGDLSLHLRLMVNMGGILAWITGNMRDSGTLKDNIKNGYNGNYTDYLHRYDELSSFHYKRISDTLLEKIDCNNKKIADVGCGTGILSFIALGKGASSMSCIDISPIMLDKCREKSIAMGYHDNVISFHEAEAGKLPFDDCTFDIVLINMVLGMVPDQQAVIKELIRILRPAGTIALSVHGPSHYREAIEAGLKALKLRYYLTNRLEYWPRDENYIKKLMVNAGLDEIETERLTWVDKFEDGGHAFDFFASSTGLWWYHRLPPQIRNKEIDKTRTYFQRQEVNLITSDVVFAFGKKGQ